MLDERLEVAIAEEQCVMVFDASGGDYGVDGFPDRNTPSAQDSKMSGSLNCHVSSAKVDHLKSGVGLPGLVEVAVGGQALKYFGQNQLANFRTTNGGIICQTPAPGAIHA